MCGGGRGLKIAAEVSDLASRDVLLSNVRYLLTRSSVTLILGIQISNPARARPANQDICGPDERISTSLKRAFYMRILMFAVHRTRCGQHLSNQPDLRVTPKGGVHC